MKESKFIGRKYHFLTLIDVTDKKNYYWFRCDCGTVKKIHIANVRRKNPTKSCGCYNKKSSSERAKSSQLITQYVPSIKKPNPSNLIIYEFWERIIHKAKLRKIEFNISAEVAEKILIQQNFKCILSGIDITLPKNSKDIRKSLSTASLDRIDSTKGYTEDNIQWVHKKINIMKHTNSDTDFINWCRMVANYHPV